MKNSTLATILLLVSLTVPCSLFATQGLTYHGRILKSDDTPVTSSSVTFRIRIKSPGSENCLLYDETQTQDLSQTNGVFTLTIGTGTRVSSTVDGGYSIDRIFSNRGTIDLSSTSPAACAIGSGYSPGSADGRILTISFDDASGVGWQTLPPQALNFVPQALDSMHFAGYNPPNFLRFDDTAAASNSSELNSTQFTDLMALIAGTSNKYTRAGANSGAIVPSFSGNPSSPTTGSLWIDTATGNLKYYNSGGVQTLGSSGGSVTSVATGTGLTGGPITSSGTISIATTGVTAATYGSATAVPTITVNAQGQITSATNTTISINGSQISGGNISTSGSISSNSSSTRSLSIYNAAGTFAATLTVPSALSANYSLTLPSDDGASSGQALITDGSGVLSWGSPTVSASSITGTLPVANGGTGSTSFTGNHIVATNGTGTALIPFTCSNGSVIKFDASGYATCGTDAGGSPGGSTTQVQFNSSGSFAGDSNLVWDNTNKRLGIGATPNRSLQVNGAIAISGASNQLVNNVGFASIFENAAGELVLNPRSVGLSGGAVGFPIVLQISDSVSGVTEGLRVHSNGFVGIGESSPSTRLDVNGAMTFKAVAAPTAAASTAKLYYDSTDNRLKISNNNGSFSNIATTADVGAAASGSGGYVQFNNGTNGFGSDSGLFWDNTNKRLGVGTATPSQKMEVNGRLLIKELDVVDGAGTGEFRSDASGVRFGSLGDANIANIFSQGNAAIAIDSNANSTTNYFSVVKDSHSPISGSPVELFRIQENGRVGIGTNNPGEILEVAGNIKASGRMIASTSANSDALSAITANFSASNTIRATGAAGACGTLDFTNTTAGGSFTVTILNATSTCTTIHWNGSTSNVKLPSGYTGGVSLSGVVYTVIDDGATLWVSYVPF